MSRELETEKLKRKLGTLYLKSFVEELYLDGKLTEKDLQSPEKISEILSEFDFEKASITISVDHRNSLLGRAKIFMNEGKTDLAFVFFGTFFEHSINFLIAEVLSKKNISIKTKNEIIRSLNIRSKFSWFLEVLGFPKFNQKHLKTILSVAENRNAFIHYKYNYEDIEIDKTEERNELLEAAEKSAIYTKRYISKVVYDGKKVKVKGKLDELFKDP